jgi:hypothetical protein
VNGFRAEEKEAEHQAQKALMDQAWRLRFDAAEAKAAEELEAAKRSFQAELQGMQWAAATDRNLLEKCVSRKSCCALVVVIQPGENFIGIGGMAGKRCQRSEILRCGSEQELLLRTRSAAVRDAHAYGSATTHANYKFGRIPVGHTPVVTAR